MLAFGDVTTVTTDDLAVVPAPRPDAAPAVVTTADLASPPAAPPAVPAARRGRAGLTPAAVVAEAARLADESRDARVPLATVADRLGVRLPSLYKHVAGADGLRRGLARLAAEDLRAALDDAATTAAAGPRDHRLGTLAVAYRRWAGERPGLYLALATPVHPDDAEHAAALAAVTDRLVEVVLAYGASGDDSVLDGVRLLRSGLHGFVSLENTGGLGVPDGVARSFERLVAVLDVALTDVASPAPAASGADTGPPTA